MAMRRSVLSAFLPPLLVGLVWFGCSLLNDSDGDGSTNPTTNPTANPAGTGTDDNTGGGTETGTGGDTTTPTNPQNVMDVSNDQSAIMGSVDTSTTSVVPTSPYANDSGGGSPNLDVPGLDPVTDGSAARLALYGETQYFYGALTDNGKEVPLVKIIANTTTPDVYDVAVVFSPEFTDNTYGTTAEGWKRKFMQVVTSDHVELEFLNGSGETVLKIRLDLLSASTDVPSGYACLGLGGDGGIDIGEPEWVLSYGSSMDDNINYYGYWLFENSPATDSIYSVNPQYPNWQYYTTYRVSLDPDAFGSSGYGQVNMTYVHASPSKGKETVTVSEGPPPDEGTPEDPFRYFTPTAPDTGSTAPPDTSTSPPDTSEIPG